MKSVSNLIMCVVLLSLFGCGSSADSESSQEEAPVATAPATETPVVVDEPSTSSRRGKILFLQCRACHSTDAADGHLVGPNLSGLFGSTAGTKENFVYSSSMAESGIVWSEDTLDGFLAKPYDYFPGTKMAFVGLPNEDDRRELIAYLKSMTNE